MEGYGAHTYGDRFADVYDRWYGGEPDTTRCVEVVAGLAAASARAATPPRATPVVLELGIGTGRLAIPLARAGCDVRGIDASAAMIERLRANGGDGIPVVIGDFEDAALPVADHDDPADPPTVDCVLCSYNTFFGLTGEGAQRRCLERIATMLQPAGRLVLEAFVPPPPDEADPDPSAVRVRDLDADRLVLTATVRDTGAQTLTGQLVEISEAGIRLRPWHLRYRTPQQLDELAAAAGLRLEHRWAGWDRAPFSAASVAHVSTYRRTD